MSTGEMARRRRRDGDKRRKLKDKLVKRGVPAEEIERILARKAEDQRAARDIIRHRGDTPRRDIDDAGYTPARHDPLLHGPARATGATAAAVKRGKTITLHQHTREGES